MDDADTLRRAPDTSASAALPRLTRNDRPARGADALVGARERLGLRGALAHLDRVATPAFAPGRAVHAAVSWEREDDRSPRWWPQGVTSVSDARLPGAPAPDPALPPLLLTTAYAKRIRGMEHGCRVTLCDLSDPERVRYGHVLLGRASAGPWDDATVQPLVSHAGGVVWHGDWLHVASTRKGVLSFHLDDLVRARALGHDMVLPLRAAWEPPDADRARMRYSFLSLARSADDGAAWLLAGEYDRQDPGRLVRFPLGPDGGFLTDDTGEVVAEKVADGVARMQGAVQLPDGRLVVSASHGRHRCGHLWVGGAGRLEQLRGALPVGPEDLTWWPERGELWTVTEYPGMRVAAAVRAADVLAPAGDG